MFTKDQSNFMIKNYYLLTKPGIVRGNLIVALAGFLFASHGVVDFPKLLFTLIGLGGVIASSCVVNNYTDRGIDRKMKRTEKRALATGQIGNSNALIYAFILGIVGLALLFFFANPTTARFALGGFLFYVIAYGYWKRKSIFGTLVGSVAGAVPPVVGYTSVAGSFDMPAFLLFMVLVFWQMPHFYAIGIFRLKDYQEANLPILPAIKGIEVAKRQIIFYMWGFLISVMLLTILGYTGFIYLGVMIAVSATWLYKAYSGMGTSNNEVWAKKMFSFSLIALLVFCIMISVDFILPF